MRQRLGREYAALHGLHRYDAVQLWFEHDLWDQAALIRVLSLLAGKRQMRGRLWLLPADGVRGFAEMGDAELAALRPAPLTDLQLEQAAEAWAAFAAPDPRALDALARQKLALPCLAAALRRHLRDLPWSTDGLGETERLLLRAVAAGAGTEAAVQAALRAADAVFHVTELIVRDVVRRLRTGPKRPLRAADPLRLTPRARRCWWAGHATGRGRAPMPGSRCCPTRPGSGTRPRPAWSRAGRTRAGRTGAVAPALPAPRFSRRCGPGCGSGQLRPPGSPCGRRCGGCPPRR